MAEIGGEETAGPVRPSRLRDYMDPPLPALEPPSASEPQSVPKSVRALEPLPGAGAAPGAEAVPGGEAGTAAGAAAELPSPSSRNAPALSEAARRRREFAALLGEFRRAPVLLPLAEDDVPLVADLGGIRWIYAFSNEEALARFAIARGEVSSEQSYRRVLGARLLDVGTVVAGVPCGVALDVGSEGEGVLFPPVTGIVPDEAAVDAETDGEGRR
ncbi:hypothetical protein ACVNF4_03985 [Streptomyces sp. S6]